MNEILCKASAYLPRRVRPPGEVIPRSAALATARQRPRRDYQRSLQSPAHSSAGTVALVRRCRVRNAGIGGLVQQSPVPRAHPATCGRPKPSNATIPCHRGVIQTTDPADEFLTTSNITNQPSGCIPSATTAPSAGDSGDLTSSKTSRT